VRFEARELKQYGEFVKAVDLVEGRVYFRVGFLDQDSVIPEFVPLVFVGRDLNPEHRGLYFQDAASHIGGERYNPAEWMTTGTDSQIPHGVHRGPEVRFETIPETEYTMVLEFEQALDMLLACSLRRRTWDGRAGPIKPRSS
jgi:hypothetical protein